MFTELRIVRRLRGAMQCGGSRLQGSLREREVKRHVVGRAILREVRG